MVINMKFPKYNLHTHTLYCDGHNSPEEMVLAAIERGIKVLGFSGHSYLPDCDWCMSPEGIVAYREEIGRLKEKYRGKITILCGIEQDYYSEPAGDGYDFIIGSVHRIYADDGAYCKLDDGIEIVQNDIQTHFDGDVFRWTRRYFETVAKVPEKTGCTIIGHFDLVQKYNQDKRLFDDAEPRYRKPLLDALDRLLEQNVIFELNTGAMARGERKEPYPSAYALRWIAQKQRSVLLSSDAHYAEKLLYGFSDAAEYAKSCGIGGFVVPDTEHPGKFRTIPLGSDGND